jgi:hypothetical protein
MPEELGKIEKPAVEEFKGGRKLYFVPLILTSGELPLEFTILYDRYWNDVESQIAGLEAKLGPVNHIFHELVPESGEAGLKTLEQMKVGSLEIIKKRIENKVPFEAIEDSEILTELMDWSRCLSIGLQSQKVFSKIYEFYNEANKNRNESISKKINELLKENESSILIMNEGHHVQFASDIRVFYVSPPVLDELKRWMRDYEAKQKEQSSKETKEPSNTPEKTE